MKVTLLLILISCFSYYTFAGDVKSESEDKNHVNVYKLSNGERTDDLLVWYDDFMKNFKFPENIKEDLTRKPLMFNRVSLPRKLGWRYIQYKPECEAYKLLLLLSSEDLLAIKHEKKEIDEREIKRLKEREEKDYDADYHMWPAFCMEYEKGQKIIRLIDEILKEREINK